MDVDVHRVDGAHLRRCVRDVADARRSRQARLWRALNSCSASPVGRREVAGLGQVGLRLVVALERQQAQAAVDPQRRALAAGQVLFQAAGPGQGVEGRGPLRAPHLHRAVLDVREGHEPVVPEALGVGPRVGQEAERTPATVHLERGQGTGDRDTDAEGVARGVGARRERVQRLIEDRCRRGELPDGVLVPSLGQQPFGPGQRVVDPAPPTPRWRG